jgi:hypothetical protein
MKLPNVVRLTAPPLARAIPRWDALEAFHASLSIATARRACLVVPLLLRLAEAAATTPFVAALGRTLDGSVSHVPVNMLRTFWASALLIAVHQLHRVLCPPIIRMTYDTWVLFAPAAHDERTELASSHGRTDPLIDASLRRRHHDLVGHASSSRPAVRALLCGLIAMSLYLLARVALDQLALVWQFTSIHSLAWKENACP